MSGRTVRRFYTKEHRDKAMCATCGQLALLNADGSLRAHKDEMRDPCASRIPLSLERVKSPR